MEVVTPVNSKRRSQPQSCTLPLPQVLLIGAGLSAAFFGLILYGPLDYTILRRYCLGHPVAIASVCLFIVGMVGLTLKWISALQQTSLTALGASGLQRLVEDGQEIVPKQRPAWLAASWQMQSERIQRSWFGARIAHVLELQISRGRRNQLEADLKSLSELEADRQHDSYSLLRIIHWAMPMLGFLGTVLGISQTLSQLDTATLASQQGDAMNQLTAGLNIAFDTTAIALILTVFSMFVQFAISRLEQSILSDIDSDANQCLIQFLSADPFDAQDNLLTPVREAMEGILTGVRQLATEQASLWSDSLLETQRQWHAWTQDRSEVVETQISQRVGLALDRHVTELSRLQEEGSRHQDLRWQQWQTTLSDQARSIQGQQKEMIKQSDALHKLIESTSDLRKLEETIQASVERLENVGRIEQATTCVGEAVAVLATCLERTGVIRGTPIRPRVASKAKLPGSLNSQDDLQSELGEMEASTIPFDSNTKKKAA